MKLVKFNVLFLMLITLLYISFEIHCRVFRGERDDEVIRYDPPDNNNNDDDNVCTETPECNFTDDVISLDVPFTENYSNCCMIASFTMLINFNYAIDEQYLVSQHASAYDNVYNLDEVSQLYCEYLLKLKIDNDPYPTSFTYDSCTNIDYTAFCLNVMGGDAASMTYTMPFLKKIRLLLANNDQTNIYGIETKLAFPNFKVYKNYGLSNRKYWSESPLMLMLRSSLYPYYLTDDLGSLDPYDYQQNLRPFPPIVVADANYSAIKVPDHSTEVCNGDSYTIEDNYNIWMEGDDTIQQLADVNDHAIVITGIQSNNYSQCDEHSYSNEPSWEEGFSSFNLATINDPNASAIDGSGSEKYNLYVDKISLDKLYTNIEYIIAPT